MSASRALLLILVVAGSLPATASAAPRRRGPSPEQVKKMKEEMAYRQREIQRVQREQAAKEKELFDQFDENKDGRLTGGERSRFNSHLEAIRTGRAASPYATIVPAGKGPRGDGGSASSDKKK